MDELRLFFFVGDAQTGGETCDVQELTTTQLLNYTRASKGAKLN
jgi:hypothetical protein